MPYKFTHKSAKCYGVANKTTGHAFSKCTTKAKAEKQMRLLHGVEHGFHPTHGSKHKK
jgi:hypothetical protein